MFDVAAHIPSAKLPNNAIRHINSRNVEGFVEVRGDLSVPFNHMKLLHLYYYSFLKVGKDSKITFL